MSNGHSGARRPPLDAGGVGGRGENDAERGCDAVKFLERVTLGLHCSGQGRTTLDLTCLEVKTWSEFCPAHASGLVERPGVAPD